MTVTKLFRSSKRFIFLRKMPSYKRKENTNRLTRGMVRPKTLEIKRVIESSVKAASRNEENIFEMIDGVGECLLKGTRISGVCPIYCNRGDTSRSPLATPHHETLDAGRHWPRHSMNVCRELVLQIHQVNELNQPVAPYLETGCNSDIK